MQMRSVTRNLLQRARNTQAISFGEILEWLRSNAQPPCEMYSVVTQRKISYRRLHYTVPTSVVAPVCATRVFRRSRSDRPRELIELKGEFPGRNTPGGEHTP